MKSVSGCGARVMRGERGRRGAAGCEPVTGQTRTEETVAEFAAGDAFGWLAGYLAARFGARDRTLHKGEERNRAAMDKGRV